MARYPNFTVVEAQNVSLGQGGAAYFNGTNTYTPTRGVVIAIQVIQDCTFASLVAENPNVCIGTNASDTHDPGITGDIVQTTTTFVAGLVLYGRWTTVDLGSGVVNLYLGN